jgi:hypothetical protein
MARITPADEGVHGTLYLIHFIQPLAHARHYFGFSEHLEERLHWHRTGSPGKASALMRAVYLAQIDWQVAATWDGTRLLERRVKNWGSLARICPICCGVPAVAEPIKLVRDGRPVQHRAQPVTA